MTAPPGRTGRLRVRPAERADLLAVMRIEKASFPQPWPYDAFRRALDEPGFLVAVDSTGDGADGDPVVGYVVATLVRSYGQPVGHVKDLAVHPGRRGEGIGSELLSRAVDALPAARAIKLEVRETNGTARRLYRRFGFEPLRRVPGYYDDGEDAIVMIREADGSDPGE